MTSALKHRSPTHKSPTHPTAKRPPPSPRPQPPASLMSVDALLDEALDDTFPASDPVALTLPSRRRQTPPRKRAAARG